MAERALRRVYEIPVETLKGIRREAQHRGQCEVATVRQLLDEALSRRESGSALETRASALTARVGLSEALLTLAFHPRVVTLTKATGRASIVCADGHTFELSEREHAHG